MRPATEAMLGLRHLWPRFVDYLHKDLWSWKADEQSRSNSNTLDDVQIMHVAVLTDFWSVCTRCDRTCS